MTLAELGDRLFADVPQTANILGCDERTVRKAAVAGEIPASKVGAKWMIPTSWLRERAGIAEATSADPGPDLDELADRVADRMFARLAGLFVPRAGDQGAA